MNLRHLSLTAQAGVVMSLIVAVSTVGMLTGLLIAESIEGIPADINQAGSLRMMSMRLAHAYDQGFDLPLTSFEKLIVPEINKFDERLHSLSLDKNGQGELDAGVESAFEGVKREWRRIRKSILDRAQDAAYTKTMMHVFASQIDELVFLVQTAADERIEQMRLIIGFALALTLLVALLTVVRLYFKIVRPLRNLVHSARNIQEGDFSHRVSYKGDDELGQLAASFNSMSSRLALMYENLENSVNLKTTELMHRNQALDVLYTSVKLLSDMPNSRDNLTSIITRLEAVPGLKNVVLCLNNVIPGEKMAGVFSSSSKGMKEFNACVRKESCAGCYRLGLGNEEDHRISEASSVVLISHKNYEFGSLYYEVDSDQADENWCHQLISTLAENLGTAFNSLRQSEHEHRLMLIEERTTIARELHDSLAQSLSFQKFQLSRFQMMLEEDQPKEELINVIKDLREGLKSAYSQLRELLTSFRLKLTDPGLEPALKGTMAEFSQRGTLDIQLDYQIRHIKLSANEEVHLLQIVREALSNIVKHAKASKVQVSLSADDKEQIFLSVSDDGIGFPQDSKKLNHHGLVIMKERAKTLSGTIDIQSNSPKGTLILGRFQLGSQNSSNEVSIGHVKQQ